MWRIQPASHAFQREFDDLPRDLHSVLIRMIDSLTINGPMQLGLPHARPLGDELWELRASAKSGIARLIYVTRPGQRLVLLHAFVKKTKQTPRRSIRIALKRLREWA